MPLIDLLRPDQRAALKRLRKKIANRECMRRIRAADRDKMLCSGVDLPIDAGTCGRWVWPGYKRCHACDARRRWFLKTALNPVESIVSALLEKPRQRRRPHAGGRRPARGFRPRRPAARRPVGTRRPCLRW